jgi:hypothetical protein
MGDIDSGFDDSPMPEPSLRFKIIMIAVGAVTLAVFFVVFFTAFHTLTQLLAGVGD